MSDLFTRVCGLFVAPAAPAAATARPALAPAGAALAAAVLGSAAHAPPVAALLAGELRLRCRAPCALIGEWRPDAVPGEPGAIAGRAARGLAARLAGRGLEAVAAGRLVRLALPAEPGSAATAWRRATAAAGCPAVLAVAGPRPAGFADLLDEQDLVALVLDAAAGELGSLAHAGLAGVRAPVVVCRPVPAAIARLVAASSVATSRALGAEMARAVKVLG